MTVLMPILSLFDVLLTLPGDIVQNYTGLASCPFAMVTFLCNRFINDWNSLPDAVVFSRSVAVFKHNLQSLDFPAV